MKKIVVAILFFFISVPAFSDYVAPNILAKQYLYELDLKETLIKAFSHKYNCKANLVQARLRGSHNDQGLGTLTKLTDNNTRRECLSGCIKTCCATKRTPCPESCTTTDSTSEACQLACVVANPVTADSDVVTIGDFKRSNVEVVKMEIEGDPGKTNNQLDDEDRTVKVYYKRSGLEKYNTIDDQTCSAANQGACFKAECTLEYQIDNPATPRPADESKCKLLSCCQDCWTMPGGF